MSNSATILSFCIFTCTFSAYFLTSSAAAASMGTTYKCAECNPTTCGKAPSNCPYGFVPDRCGCCTVCGNGEGDFCDGRYNEFGRCGDGLMCMKTSDLSLYGICIKDVYAQKEITPSPFSRQDQSPPKPKDESPSKEASDLRFDVVEDDRNMDNYEIDPKSKPKKHPLPVHNMPQGELTLMDDPSSVKQYSNKKTEHNVKKQKRDKCHPECTPEFCKDNPRALCSAANQLERNNQKCGDPCGTTVCRACQMTFDPFRSCQACPTGAYDEKCIKDFGRCVKKGIVSLKRSDTFHGHTNFNCAIPTC